MPFPWRGAYGRKQTICGQGKISREKVRKVQSEEGDSLLDDRTKIDDKLRKVFRSCCPGSIPGIRQADLQCRCADGLK